MLLLCGNQQLISLLDKDFELFKILHFSIKLIPPLLYFLLFFLQDKLYLSVFDISLLKCIVNMLNSLIKLLILLHPLHRTLL
jgi:hypothetical protein